MNGNLMGKRVVTLSASDHAEVLDGGHVFAWSGPVYHIRRDDGSEFTWREDHIKEAPPEPTVQVPVRLLETLRVVYENGQPFSVMDTVQKILDYRRADQP